MYVDPLCSFSPGKLQVVRWDRALYPKMNATKLTIYFLKFPLKIILLISRLPHTSHMLSSAHRL